MRVELIPSAKRLIRSLRDIGYDFVDAIADIVDNSIEAQATVIGITIKFAGEDSYLTIADNGIGMASKDIQEALRFGSNRAYDDSDDLGRYGLGLKTASLSQCERLTVSARRGEERARINSYCWDLDHIERTNRWEILKIGSDEIKDEAWHHLQETTGTVVTWERLGRMLGYKYPSGDYARKQVGQMAESLKLHLGMVFHRFLSGEIDGKRISIYINAERVLPWDPYCRGEQYTQELDQILIPLAFNQGTFNVRFQPYILPPMALFSSPKAHKLASGPYKWNKQQGLYIYRSNRIIQAGGWSGIRTSDEHTKLLRIAVFIPPQLAELFQVNVAKKHLTMPRELRSALLKELQPIVQCAQEAYRDKTISEVTAAVADAPQISADAVNGCQPIATVSNLTLITRTTGNARILEELALENSLIERAAAKAGIRAEARYLHELIRTLFETAENHEKLALRRMIERYLASQNRRIGSEQDR